MDQAEKSFVILLLFDDRSRLCIRSICYSPIKYTSDNGQCL